MYFVLNEKAKSERRESEKENSSLVHLTFTMDPVITSFLRCLGFPLSEAEELSSSLIGSHVTFEVSLRSKREERNERDSEERK